MMESGGELERERRENETEKVKWRKTGENASEQQQKRENARK
jgi:hypothetical protein